MVGVGIYRFHFFGVAAGLLELESCFLGDFSLCHPDHQQPFFSD